MALLPARNILDGTALPVTSQMKTALGSLRDYCSDLLGTDSSNKAAARTALGAAASGANTDITSLGAVTGVTAALADNTTKLATTAFVIANAPVVADATETAAGKIELATAAEAIAGTDAVRAITPAGLRSGLNASGAAPVYACRAWVNFNGSGTVTIRASGNVSSVTDNGVGDYTVNFATALIDTNYSVSLARTSFSASNLDRGLSIAGNDAGATTKTTSSLRLISGALTVASLIDCGEINVTIFR